MYSNPNTNVIKARGQEQDRCAMGDFVHGYRCQFLVVSNHWNNNLEKAKLLYSELPDFTAKPFEVVREECE